MAAAKKKPKAKAKSSKAPAGKPVKKAKKVAAKKAAPKKAAPNKAAAKKTAAKKPAPKTPARGAAAQAPRAAAPAPKPAARQQPAAVAPPARPQPLPGEEPVGIVVHYFNHLSVAVVHLDAGTLRIGDTIRIIGHTSDFRQKIESLQIEHEKVDEVERRQEFGLKVKEHVREHDVVYKVSA